MGKQNTFFRAVCALAIPVALQSMLQSSFSVVDQIMIGQLGSDSVAGVGLAGKFASIFSVVIAAVGAAAGIMLSQYLGQKNRAAVRRSFFTNLFLGVGIAACFTALCLFFPDAVMGLYTKDPATRQEAADYLLLMAGTFLPMAGATLLSTLFRCIQRPQLPLYASIASALLNTGLNYLLIFGKLGITPMGVRGAALATVASQWVNFLLMGLMLLICKPLPGRGGLRASGNWKQYLSILLPILVCEVVWSLGENVYAAIYGRMGTEAGAAMTLTNPVQGLLIGALCGLSQAASVLIGKRLGEGNDDAAYRDSKKLILYGAIGAAVLSAVVLLTAPVYVLLYRVEAEVRSLTVQVLSVYALIAPVKVLNMILSGGILRSGGRTKYVMYIDMIGTWCFGVPLGLLAAFVLEWSIPWVYLLLSLEEGIRLGIAVAVFLKKRWMNRLEAA